MTRNRYSHGAWMLAALAALSGGLALATARQADSSVAAAVVDSVNLPVTHSATAFTVDPVHSTVIFRIKHLKAAYFYGRFNTVNGSFQLDPEKPETGSIVIEIDVTSIDSNNAGRDKHLKSPDFFNAAQFPTISFTSTHIARNADGTYAVSGTLTLNGTKRDITATLEHTGENTVPRFGHRAGIETTLVIKRSDFGMTFMPEMLGDEVRLIISLEGVEK